MGGLWQTDRMPKAKRCQHRDLLPSATSSKACKTLKEVLEVSAVALKHGDRFVFPELSGAVAAELMRAAGILDSAGKLSKTYRRRGT